MSELAERFGTPLYVYDGDSLRGQYLGLRERLHPAMEIFYSLKANPNVAVCALLGSLGARAEVSSMVELRHRARRRGGPARHHLPRPRQEPRRTRGMPVRGRLRAGLRVVRGTGGDRRAGPGAGRHRTGDAAGQPELRGQGLRPHHGRQTAPVRDRRAAALRRGRPGQEPSRGTRPGRTRLPGHPHPRSRGDRRERPPDHRPGRATRRAAGLRPGSGRRGRWPRRGLLPRRAGPRPGRCRPPAQPGGRGVPRRAPGGPAAVGARPVPDRAVRHLRHPRAAT